MTQSKKTIAQAVYSFLQTGKYQIEYQHSGSSTSDDDAIAELIDLRQISLKDVTEILNERGDDANTEPAHLLARIVSPALCSAWIAQSPEVTIGYDHTNRYFQGLRAGASTTFYIA